MTEVKVQETGRAGGHCLQVYVSDHCVGCEEAVRLAEGIARAFPAVRVEVVSVDRPGTVLPPEIFATPSYVWNGRLYSLGNPEPDALAALITSAMGESGESCEQ